MARRPDLLFASFRPDRAGERLYRGREIVPLRSEKLRPARLPVRAPGRAGHEGVPPRSAPARHCRGWRRSRGSLRARPARACAASCGGSRRRGWRSCPRSSSPWTRRRCGPCWPRPRVRGCCVRWPTRCSCSCWTICIGATGSIARPWGILGATGGNPAGFGVTAERPVPRTSVFAPSRSRRPMARLLPCRRVRASRASSVRTRDRAAAGHRPGRCAPLPGLVPPCWLRHGRVP